MPAAQIEVIGLLVAGVPDDARNGIPDQADTQALGDCPGDLILDVEDVFDIAIVALGPDLIAVGDVREPDGDAQAIAGAPYAAVQHCRDVQLLADGGQIVAAAAERERRRTRRDGQPLSCDSVLRISSAMPSQNHS